LNPAAVHRVLVRCRLNRLAWMDGASGRVIRPGQRTETLNPAPADRQAPRTSDLHPSTTPA
jgi:hypothetical protein